MENNFKSEYSWAFDYIRSYFFELEVIAEIGSRDGLDAIDLAQTFKSKFNYVFEADPDLAKEIELKISNSKKESNFFLYNLALGNQDKSVKFLAVDLEKYENKGVGSLFEINFNNREISDPDNNRQNVQKTIDVEMKRYSSLDLKTPDLIAMDVQGAELEVLKGFEEQLHDVKFIILESSISENYLGGSNFSEIHQYLRNKFKLIASSRHSEKNYKLFWDNFKYKWSTNKKYQPDLNLFYINKSLL